MKSKTTFTLNGENITKAFENTFDSVQSTRLKVTSKAGKEYFNLPLIFALVLAIVLPVLIVVAIIISIVTNLTISFERENKATAPHISE
ncbi:DUF4342 domain-containing protein [Sphingobacterium alkalisoli]|uniref:DUF4342 domain-containing protein n=1 Tax=Sphingobacterium alkalisoli TaxID=1874115 RepID=A0A4U0GV42_9SPHI|nr:DUF4342 domain-containing protein [Sphingobacterium alkalisoli]TJY62434.1 DUF4342 domain-containing protein [Sphingobacterium alkalisoli]GGH29515.1 hypothetical protein GCM10011418_40870 [Sphingobacterium alkalisoli]